MEDSIETYYVKKQFYFYYKIQLQEPFKIEKIKSSFIPLPMKLWKPIFANRAAIFKLHYRKKRMTNLR